MADNEDNKKENLGDDGEMVQVPQSFLTKMAEDMAELERGREEDRARVAGLEEVVKSNSEVYANGEPKLREKKSFEPKFRTVRIRKTLMNEEDLNSSGYVIGWTNRGAYQVVDRTGVAPVLIDMIDLIFLGHEKSKGDKLQVFPVRLLDFLNKSVQVHCKIVDQKKEPKKVQTGEEIDVAIFDPAHGLVTTGDKIDGYVVRDEIQYKIQIPGITEPVWIDALYANA